MNAADLSGAFDKLCRELYRELCRNPLNGRSEIDKARDKAYDKEGLNLALLQRHSGQALLLDLFSERASARAGDRVRVWGVDPRLQFPQSQFNIFVCRKNVVLLVSTRYYNLLMAK